MLCVASPAQAAAPLRVGGRRAAPPGGIHRFACRHDAACYSGRTRAAAPNALCLPAQPSTEDALHAGAWWVGLGVLRVLAVTVSGLPVFPPSSRTGAAAATLRVGRRRAAAFMERSRCRLRSVFLLTSFLPPKKPCAPCSSVAVFLALFGGVRGAAGLQLRAALRRDKATVVREQHHPLCLAHFQTLETTRRVFSKALETPAWGRLRCVFRECLTAVVQ